MKKRMTFTISPAAVDDLLGMANRSGESQSAIIEALILNAADNDTTADQPFNEADYMESAQACTALNCSREYVRQLREAGKLPYVQRAGRFLYLAEAVKALAKKREQ
jgi:hypothetical protein